MAFSETPDSAILRAEHLGRVVGAKVLVENANFSLASGEILAIVGPSGSGKSSLLRLLNRLDEPSRGTVYLAGTDYKQIAPRELRRKVGMVTQRPYLFAGSVEQNLQFSPLQRGETHPRRSRSCWFQLGWKVMLLATSPTSREAKRSGFLWLVLWLIRHRFFFWMNLRPLWTTRPSQESSC